MRRIPIIAGCVVLSIVGFLIASNHWHAAPPETGGMLHFNPTDVNELVVRDRAGATVTVVREQGRWQLQNTSHDLADPKQITAAIDALAALPADAPIAESSQTSQQFGLAPAAFEIVIARDTTTLAELRIGDNDDASDLAYVQGRGETVYRAPASALLAIEEWVQQPPALK